MTQNAQVAIVGRPNVGKSTLFNRLLGEARAIVEDQPGVTRDRIYGQVLFNKKKPELGGYTLVDTGGFESSDFSFQPFDYQLIFEQTIQAISQSQLVLFVVDGKHGVDEQDRKLFNRIKQINKKILCLCNKVDGQEQSSVALEFYELGVEEVFVISAAHRYGIPQLKIRIHDELNEALTPKSFKLPLTPEQKRLPKIAILGKPNAGKSSLLNKLTGEERSIVSDVAGTTRDSVDATVRYKGRDYQLYDTAGIRKKARINEKLEVASISQSLSVLGSSDIVLYVIDATIGITDQDLKLIQLISDRFIPILIVCNKWDLIKNKKTNTVKEWTEEFHYRLAGKKHIPILFTSIATNQRVSQILEYIHKLYELSGLRASTSQVNRALSEIVEFRSPHLVKKFNKHIKFFYATQISTYPPTIIIKTNVSGEIRESYKKYVKQQLRKKLGFTMIDIKVVFESKSEHKKDATV